MKKRFSFRSLNIRKREKSPSQISAPICFLVFETNNFIIFKLKTALCGILLFIQILIVRFISFWVESVEKGNSYWCPELGVRTRCPGLGANLCTYKYEKNEENNTPLRFRYTTRFLRDTTVQLMEPNSGHFLFLLLYFRPDSAHTSFNPTEIIWHKSRNHVP